MDKDDRRERLKQYREEMKDQDGYTPEFLTVGIFLVMTITLALMGNGLVIVLGGPAFVSPFIYLALRGYI